ncbi:unnamed protein product, partial [Rotaria sp. Silwood1]
DLAALRQIMCSIIQSNVSAKECADSVFDMNLRPEQEMQVCQIILDGATQQQIYEHLFALLAVELSIHAYYSHAIKLNISDPLSLDVAVIDASILLYGTIFIRVSNKYHVQQETVQVNRFTTILIGLRTLAETKQSSSINDDNVNKSACIFVMQTLSHQNPILCCAADEILGRLTQVICGGHFVADIAQIYFDRLKEFHDISSHTGYLLALECLHRYIDGISTELYLNLSLSILLVLEKDQSTSIVQV